MKLEYLGHACFRINDSLVIDPYKDNAVPGMAPLRTSGTEVIYSHGHADHSGVDCVEIVPGSADEHRFEIEKIPCWHDEEQGRLRGPNTISVITTSDSKKLAHLGDLGHFPNPEQLAKISDVDYLLIPVGGHATIDAQKAVEICLAAQPRHIIPMHYRTATSGYPDFATVDDFLKLAEENNLMDKVVVMALGQVEQA